MNLFRKMIVNAAAFFLVGVALGLLMPPIAAALGASGLVTVGGSTLALWEGITFGIFGFIAPPLSKLCGTLLGDPDQKAAAEQKQESEQIKSRINTLEHVIAPSRHVQQLLDRGPHSSFANAEEARATEPQTPTIH